MIIAITMAAPLTNEYGTLDAVNSTYNNTNSYKYARVINMDTDFMDDRIYNDSLTSIHLEFRVQFNRNTTPPVLYFYSTLPGSQYVSPHIKGRTGKCLSAGKGFALNDTMDKHFVLLGKMSAGGECQETGEDFVCSGERAFRTAYARSWWLAIGYECVKTSMRPLRTINISVALQMVVNQPVMCMKLNSEPICGYDKTALPNAWGYTEVWEVLTIQRSVQRIQGTYKCHQHLDQFTCRSLNPECISEQGSRGPRAVLPCRKLCEEVVESCKTTPFYRYVRIDCGLFPDTLDPEVCFYKPVTCPEPSVPTFGQVRKFGDRPSNVSLYTCDKGYRLVGKNTIVCMHSGMWNNTAPRCEVLPHSEADKGSPPVSVILSVTIGLTLTLLFIGLCIFLNIHRMKFAHLYAHNTPEEYSTPHPGLGKSLFLTYSSIDSDVIKNDIMPEMNKQLPSWRVMTFETDFLPGLRVTECIEKSVADCDAFVILLTQHYADSDWCLFEFTQAEMKSKLDSHFKVVFILKGDDVDIENLQDNLKKGVKTKETLSLNDKLFWDKLCKYLES